MTDLFASWGNIREIETSLSDSLVKAATFRANRSGISLFFHSEFIRESSSAVIVADLDNLPNTYGTWPMKPILVAEIVKNL